MKMFRPHELLNVITFGCDIIKFAQKLVVFVSSYVSVNVNHYFAVNWMPVGVSLSYSSIRSHEFDNGNQVIIELVVKMVMTALNPGGGEGRRKDSIFTAPVLGCQVR